MSEGVRIDSRGWTGDMAPEPIWHGAPGGPIVMLPLAWVLVSLGIVLASGVHGLAWWYGWHRSGEPAVIALGPTAAEATFLCLLMAAAILPGRRSLPFSARSARAAFLTVAVLMLMRLADYQIAFAASAREGKVQRLFVEGLQSPGFGGNHSFLTATLDLTDAAGRPRHVMVPVPFLEGLRRGDTCFTARL